MATTKRKPVKRAATKKAPAKKTAAKKSPAKKPSARAAVIDAAFEIPAGLVPVIEAFAGDGRVALGRMFSSRGVLNVDGKLFAMVVKERLVVKLPKARVDALVAEGTGVRFEPGPGRVMKEWVSVAPGALPWIALAQEARRFVGGAK